MTCAVEDAEMFSFHFGCLALHELGRSNDCNTFGPIVTITSLTNVTLCNVFTQQTFFPIILALTFQPVNI